MTCIFLRTAIIWWRSSGARSTPSKQDLARGRVVEAQHQAAEGGFPAPQLADEAQRLAALDADCHVVDGAHQLGLAEEPDADGEILLGALDGEDVVGIAADDAAACSKRRPRCNGGSSASISATRWQAATWPGSAVTNGGSSRHFSMAKRQRGRKRQPDGGLSRLGGAPSMVESLALRPRSSLGTAVEQAARVGVHGPAEHALGRAALDQARGIHHVHAVGVARDDAEIVRDDDDGDAEAAREVLHQLQDLRLDGDVERRGRLVGDQQLRDCRQDRWRSSRAGACRRTADADTG